MNTNSCDIMIVGAGIAGASLAWALRDSGWQVVLLEAGQLHNDVLPLEWSVSGFDARVSALTAASADWLQQQGIWPELEARRLCGFANMQVWDGDGTGNIDFSAVDVNQPALGYIVENREITAALHQRLLRSPIHCLQSLSLQQIHTLVDAVELELSDGSRWRSRLVVAADGALSAVRQQAGFATREWDYAHHAIVATVQTEQPHRATAWQRFMPQGPLAFLPLPAASGMADSDGHFSSIVWSTQPQQAADLMAMSAEEFNTNLAAAFEHRLGAVVDSSRRFSFPLRQRHAQDYRRGRVVLTGDAAHTIHPLAGQGINLGLADVAVLAQELLRAEQRQLDPADDSVLQRYQRRRQSDNLLMMALMDGFKRLYEQKALPLRLFRSEGMSWLNRQPWLKRQLIRRAMGLPS